jgi:hypothetical protein
MSDEVDVKAGYTPDDVAALMETLRGMVELEEGELYTLRKGQLHHVVPRDEDSGLRRIKVMEEAYDAAQHMARRLRQQMRGYRPDPALVVSACVMHILASLAPEDADAIVMTYLQRLFTRAEPAVGEDGDAVAPGVEASAAPAPRRAVHATRRAPAAL